MENSIHSDDLGEKGYEENVRTRMWKTIVENKSRCKSM
jgi:hypothetical protein